MSKKSIDKKKLRQVVTESRAAGKTDREIYDELSVVYFDKRSIARIINGTITPERKEQYKFYQYALLTLIGITILFKVVLVVNLSVALGKPAVLLVAFVVPLINILFFVQIARYNAEIYKTCALLTLVSMLQSMARVNNAIDMVATLILGSGIAILAFSLSSKLFPHFSIDPKKGPDGEYIS